MSTTIHEKFESVICELRTLRAYNTALINDGTKNSTYKAIKRMVGSAEKVVISGKTHIEFCSTDSLDRFRSEYNKHFALKYAADKVMADIPSYLERIFNRFVNSELESNGSDLYYARHQNEGNFYPSYHYAMEQLLHISRHFQFDFPMMLKGLDAFMEHHGQYTEESDGRFQEITSTPKMIRLSNSRSVVVPHLNFTNTIETYQSIIAQIHFQITHSTCDTDHARKEVENAVFNVTCEFITDGAIRSAIDTLTFFTRSHSWFTNKDAEFRCLANLAWAYEYDNRTDWSNEVIDSYLTLNNHPPEKLEALRMCLGNRSDDLFNAIKNNPSLFDEVDYECAPMFDDLRKEQPFRDWFRESFKRQLQDLCIEYI